MFILPTNCITSGKRVPSYDLVRRIHVQERLNGQHGSGATSDRNMYDVLRGREQVVRSHVMHHVLRHGVMYVVCDARVCGLNVFRVVFDTFLFGCTVMSVLFDAHLEI